MVELTITLSQPAPRQGVAADIVIDTAATTAVDSDDYQSETMAPNVKFGQGETEAKYNLLVRRNRERLQPVRLVLRIANPVPAAIALGTPATHTINLEPDLQAGARVAPQGPKVAPRN
jgi:hypothetical protein